MLSARGPALWALFGLCWTTAASLAGEESRSAWDPKAAARALDERAEVWLRYDGADRGRGASKTSCVCCHTTLPYLLARPTLRKLNGEGGPAGPEAKILEQVRSRVANWGRIESPEWSLLYTSDPDKKRESRGTEAVMNALVLATGDRADGPSKATDATARAFDVLWATQRMDGPDAGSWEWLNFGLEPWEADDGRYFGATLAAVAIGAAPGDLAKGHADRLDRLRGYLRHGREEQSLFNRLALLRASTSLDGLLDPAERTAVASEVLARQQPDGGWRLASLGDYGRSDGTPQPGESDGYATGFALDALLSSGLKADDPRLARARSWLVQNQQPGGAWVGRSLNKKRDPSTHVGKFMSDAATACAAIALARRN